MSTAAKSIAGLSSHSQVVFSPSNRIHAVGIIIGGRLVSIVEQHVSAREAKAFCSAYNRVADNRKAEVIRQSAVLSLLDRGGMLTVMV